jgi:uncharacterized membrane protein
MLERTQFQEEENEEIGKKALPASSWYLPALIVFLGGILRLYRLGIHSVWLDEAHMIWIASKSTGEMLRYIHTLELHPYLYYFIIHPVIHLFGYSEFILRFPSALAGTAGVYAVYLLGRETGGRKAGLLAALVTSVSSFELLFSQEIRMYSFQNLFIILMAYHFIKALNTGEKRHWFFYSLLAVLGVYTDYRTGLVLVSLTIFHLVFLGKFREHLRKSLYAYLSIIALCIPLVFLIIRQSGPQGVLNSHSLFFVRPGFYRMLYYIYSVFGGIIIPTGKYISAAAALAFLLLVSWGIYRESLEKNTDGLFVPLVCFISLFLFFTLLRSKIYSVRHIIFLSPLMTVALVNSLLSFRGRLKFIVPVIVSLMLLINLWSLNLWYFKPGYGTQNFRFVTRAVERELKPGDAVALVPDYQQFAFLHYYRGENEPFFIAPRTLNNFEKQLLSQERVWWIFAGDIVIDYGGTIRAWVNDNFIIEKAYVINNLNYEITGPTLEVYVTRPRQKIPGDSENQQDQ